jgi:hypothetical protein
LKLQKFRQIQLETIAKRKINEYYRKKNLIIFEARKKSWLEKNLCKKLQNWIFGHLFWGFSFTLFAIMHVFIDAEVWCDVRKVLRSTVFGMLEKFSFFSGIL